MRASQQFITHLALILSLSLCCLSSADLPRGDTFSVVNQNQIKPQPLPGSGNLAREVDEDSLRYQIHPQIVPESQKPPSLASDDNFDFESIGLSHNVAESMNKLLASSHFLHGFFASLAVIIVSELGDKTFFIAAILAMRHSRCTVLTAALGALALMTVLAAFLGHLLRVIPRVVTFYASSILLLVFGVKMFFEASAMSDSEGLDEMEEVQQQIKRAEDDAPRASTSGLDPESGVFVSSGAGGLLGNTRRLLTSLLSPVFIQAFTLTFLAEWGDRSQVATVVLAAREMVSAVIVGGILGHAFCTGLAVLGGRIIAQRISVKAVTYIGGIVFLIFGISALYFGP